MTGKKASILVSCMILVFAIAGCGPSARGGGAAEPTGTPEAGAPEEEGEGEGEAVSDLDTPLACPVSVEDMDEGKASGSVRVRRADGLAHQAHVPGRLQPLCRRR
jgi:hypothetical protein